MRIHGKSIIAAILTASLLFAYAAPVFADNSDDTGVTPENSTLGAAASVEDGCCRFVNVNSGKAMTVSGSNLRIGTFDDTNDQRFFLTKIDRGTPTFKVGDFTTADSCTGIAVEPSSGVSTESVLKQQIKSGLCRPSL